MLSHVNVFAQVSHSDEIRTGKMKSVGIHHILLKCCCKYKKEGHFGSNDLSCN